jgi:TolB-like protein
MALWTAEINQIDDLLQSFRGQIPVLEKELNQLIKTDDPNVLMLYSRRCLEVIITDLCECELKRPRKTEPLKGIIDKLNKEEKVPSHIITSMDGLNSLSTYGAHPKDFDPEQVRPVLNNLSIITKWYLKYKGIEITKARLDEEYLNVTGSGVQPVDVTKLEKSVAILPFINDSPDEENTYFINGLMEEVLNNLQKIKDLRVISRTSVEQYRNQTKPIPEIAKELGVNYIVEGSGQKYGNSFRLRTQLIMAAKESHLWGESYQQKITQVEDIFRIQSEVAESIAKELRAVITPEEKGLIEKVPTNELEAYDAYLKGQFHWRKLTPNDLSTAMQYFELAKEKDPNYAPAYAGISDVWQGRQQMGYISPNEAGPRAFEAVMKALELDPNRAEVHYTLGCMYTWGMWNWEAGEKAFRRAIDLKPAYPEARRHYSHLLNILGRPQEASDQIELAIKQDPVNPLSFSFYALNLIFFRQYEDAVNTAHKALEIDPTSNPAYSALSFGHYLLGNYSDAIDAYIKAVSSIGINVLHDFESKSESDNDFTGKLKQMAELMIDLRKESYVLPLLIAELFAMAGDNENALDWLEKGYEEHDPILPYLLVPILDNLRDKPRFQEIARKMNLPYK